MVSIIIGILVASPTSSMYSIWSQLNPEIRSASLRHVLKSLMKGSRSYSNCSLVKCLLKSISSMRLSNVRSASLFDVRSFLIFSIASSILSFPLGFSLTLQPCFFWNSSANKLNSIKSMFLAPKFRFECVEIILVCPCTKDANVTVSFAWPKSTKHTILYAFFINSAFLKKP